MENFKFGKKSKQELVGVHPDLIRVVNEALRYSEVDFAVHDGMRTPEEQAALVKAGASRTSKSRHLTGHAVDLIPYVNGKMRWEWEPIFKIARAVQRAAKEQGVPIRWGGVWDRELQSIGDPKKEEEAYVARRLAKKLRAFVDGPHFELPARVYKAQ